MPDYIPTRQYPYKICVFVWDETNKKWIPLTPNLLQGAEIRPEKIPKESNLYVIWTSGNTYDIIVNPQINYGYDSDGKLIEVSLTGYSLVNQATKTYKKTFIYDNNNNLITETAWTEVV